MKKILLSIITICTVVFSGCSISKSAKERIVYYVESDGARLPVVISGQDTKDIIIYVHGGPGSSGILYYYAPAWVEMRKKYRMVFYDQRGSGGGRGHISEDSITVDQHVVDLRRVIKSIKTLYPDSNIILFGHSYGGMIAGAFTTVYQDMVKKLILLSPALNVVDLSTRIPDNMISTFIDPYLARTDISQSSRQEWQDIKQFYLDNKPLQLNSFIKHNSYVNKADLIMGLDKFNEYYDSMFMTLASDPVLEPLIWAKQLDLILPILDRNKESSRNLETDPKFNLSKITIPAMLIVGEQDLVVPKNNSMDSFTKISSVKKVIHTYNPGTHNAFLEQPQKIQQDMIDFMLSVE